jgi:hypothetical protein
MMADEQTTWDTPGFKEYHRRMQLFILLFIEGGSYVHVSPIHLSKTG